jgi:uncharacterized protein YyaL (SSP411 family)
MTYCNARLPQALFAAARLFPDDPRYVDIASQSLNFLLDRTRVGKNGYAPIGNERMDRGDWFKMGDKRPPAFDQQPVDAGALTECCAEAYRVTGEPSYLQAMRNAFGWYLGENVHNLPVVNMETGGVADALMRHGLNRNQGAESVLSIHMAYLAMKAAEL